MEQFVELFSNVANFTWQQLLMIAIGATLIYLAIKKEMEQFLAEADEPPPLLHPNMATYYRLQVADLYDALQEDSEAKRMTASDIIRSLVQEIILTPVEDELLIDVRGDLAGILAISLNTKKPATRAGSSQLEMVAGTCSGQNLQTQKNRPVGAADVRDARSQLEMVAGAGFHLCPNFPRSVPVSRLHEVENAEQLAA